MALAVTSLTVMMRPMQLMPLAVTSLTVMMRPMQLMPLPKNCCSQDRRH